MRGSETTLTPNAVEVYISRLRNKLDQSGMRIRTIHGFGHMLVEPAATGANAQQ